MKPEECKEKPTLLSDDILLVEMNEWAITKFIGEIYILHGKYGVVDIDRNGKNICGRCKREVPAGLLLLAKMEGYKE